MWVTGRGMGDHPVRVSGVDPRRRQARDQGGSGEGRVAGASVAPAVRTRTSAVKRGSLRRSSGPRKKEDVDSDAAPAPTPAPVHPPALGHRSPSLPTDRGRNAPRPRSPPLGRRGRPPAQPQGPTTDEPPSDPARARAPGR